ncbi:MAG TPA: FecR domain-containing protein [Planctomycetota bacterium]|nr:FecR domain-containing protein [Planctomycetota bacterium]
MSDEEDRLIHVLLERELGGLTPPDLVGKVAARAYPRKGRYLWWAASAAAVLAVAIALMLGLRGRYPVPRVDGRELGRGTVVTTQGSAATLTLGGYCHVQVEPASRLRTEGTERAEAILLEAGGVDCEVDRRVGSFAVRAGACTVSATGTRFTVRIPEAAAKGVFVSVQAGTVLVAAPDAEKTLRAGQEWTWTAASAPPEPAFRPGERVTITGMAGALVADAKDPSVANATVTVTAADGTQVVYDVYGWAGVIVARQGDGKRVEVTGVVGGNDGKRTITGKSVDAKIIIVEEKPK